MSFVYLLHFEEPIGDTDNPRGQAQHYIGCCDDLEHRLREHRAGQGACITREVARRGIPMRLVRVWEGDYALERRLKAQHNAPRICPLCNELAHNHAREEGVPLDEVLDRDRAREAAIVTGIGS